MYVSRYLNVWEYARYELGPEIRTTLVSITLPIDRNKPEDVRAILA